MSFSTDSTQMVYYTDIGNGKRGYRFLNLTSGIVLPTTVETSEVEDVAAFRTSGGTRVLYTVGTRSVTKWVLSGSSYQLEWTWSNIAYGSHRVSLSPDGAMLAVSANPAKVFDTETHAEVIALTNALSVRFSPSGEYLAVGGTGSVKKVTIFKVSPWSITQIINVGSAIFGLDWYRDEQSIACTYRDALRRYRVSDGAKLWDTGSTSLWNIFDLMVDKDDNCVLADNYRFATVWDGSGQNVKMISGGSSGINGFEYSPIGSFLASATNDPGIRLWNPWTGYLNRSLFHTASSSSYPVAAVAFTGDGKKLVSTDRNLDSTRGNIRVFDPLTAMQINTQVMYQGNSPDSIDVSLAPVGANGYLLASSDGQNVRLWSLNNYLGIKVLTDADSDVAAVKFSPKGTYLAVASSNGKVRIYKTGTWLVQATLSSTFSSYGMSLAFSPNEQTLYCQNDAVIHRFSRAGTGTWTDTLQKTLTFTALSVRRPSISASKDGKSVFATLGEAAVLMSAPALTVIRQWTPYGGQTDITCSRISPDSTALAVGDWTGVTRVFQNANGPTLVGLSVSPGTITGGLTATGTIRINTAAPAGGVRVFLSDDTSAMSEPSTMTIPAGATSVNFAVRTKAVAQTVTRRLSATCAGVIKTFDVTIKAP
jgi:WD40 repeat protein